MLEMCESFITGIALACIALCIGLVISRAWNKGR